MSEQSLEAIAPQSPVSVNGGLPPDVEARLVAAANDPADHRVEWLNPPPQNSLPLVWTIWRDHHGKRGGFMLSKRNTGEQYGAPGSRGRSFNLTVWRNP